MGKNVTGSVMKAMNAKIQINILTCYEKHLELLYDYLFSSVLQCTPVCT